MDSCYASCEPQTYEINLLHERDWKSPICFDISSGVTGFFGVPLCFWLLVQLRASYGVDARTDAVSKVIFSNSRYS